MCARATESSQTLLTESVAANAERRSVDVAGDAKSANEMNTDAAVVAFVADGSSSRRRCLRADDTASVTLRTTAKISADDVFDATRATIPEAKARLAFESTPPHCLADTPASTAASSTEGGGVGVAEVDKTADADGLGAGLSDIEAEACNAAADAVSVGKGDS